ncbi:transcription antiterminator LicT [Clostridium pasteurianum DSM 525 = ATCC 6013]|uniref:Transcription antiterminator LicT n=1 Tax=Clostridium pasteurianum DSM 525 = ATCC 6013 TaxID=1262449 RepID=A0A0H3JB35_CLOPA|nr:PRD domain-containing protein [Clostridium pasteurianum]AJA49050.1 transcription antiterminator LicT [Clostridium pasteurianum DSM 525 = ATCC 6013]AJA53038.1 transcription antiterminator LicT [Clostridium pasteurianum DSM 525 = ATCC 6013]AOZ76254.1 transcription antiterminator LicT [Clostridium pasteurianum DSM 525 = ATCC 6013]AOZ80050.1 transcription antiterminator LicT [Clostridium pasteurianum]ELP58988.1 Transcriptional antiterminator licT [Clostridium pasteurianum DSM 525 = ATCC 6013]
MIIKKILNNNVVTTLDKNTKLEKVVMGRGIAFQKKTGDIISNSKIEKVFILENTIENEKFQKLINEIPLEYVKLSEAIISYGKEKLNTEFYDHIYIALTDHIAFAIKRFKEGINLKNHLLWEIQRIHKKEYEVGLWAIKLIEKELDIKMNIDEAGYIALHLIDASLNESMDNTMNITTIVQQILNIIKYFFTIEFNEEDISYDRLITHLKYFAQRVISNKTLSQDQDEFLEIVRENYKQPHNCALKIKKFVEKNYHYKINDGEVVYLTLHIQRVISSIEHN